MAGGQVATLTLLGLVILGLVTLVVILIMVPFEKIFGRGGRESTNFHLRPPMLISIHLKNAWTRSEQRVDVTASYEVGFIPKAYAHARLSGLSDRQVEEVAESLSLEGLEAALRELYIPQLLPGGGGRHLQVIGPKTDDLLFGSGLFLVDVKIETVTDSDENGHFASMGKYKMKIHTSFRGMLAKDKIRISFDAIWEISTPLLLSPEHRLQIHEEAREIIFGKARLLVARTTTKQISNEPGRFFELLFDSVNDGLLEGRLSNGHRKGLGLVGIEEINEITSREGIIYRNPNYQPLGGAQKTIGSSKLGTWSRYGD